MTKKVKELGKDQVKTILDNLASDFLRHKFKFKEGYGGTYELYLDELQTERDNMKANGQSYDKEQNYIDNVKKVVKLIETRKTPPGKEALKKKVKSSDAYLYAILLNLEKIGIIEKA